MKRAVAGGLMLVVAVEVLALALPDRRFLLAAAGVAVAVAVGALRWHLSHDARAADPGAELNDLEKLLRRWLSRTESLISWSESTRRDWDRHLRPMLARQFSVATGQRQAKDPASFTATGRMVFGADLWAWVDPNNVTLVDAGEPGPGRATLDEILRRLEHI